MEYLHYQERIYTGTDASLTRVITMLVEIDDDIIEGMKKLIRENALSGTVTSLANLMLVSAFQDKDLLDHLHDIHRTLNYVDINDLIER
jgi:hypothetical protein